MFSTSSYDHGTLVQAVSIWVGSEYCARETSFRITGVWVYALAVLRLFELRMFLFFYAWLCFLKFLPHPPSLSTVTPSKKLLQINPKEPNQIPKETDLIF